MESTHVALTLPADGGLQLRRLGQGLKLAAYTLQSLGMVNFSRNIRLLLSSYGDVERIASAARISRVTLSRIANGHAEPKISTAHAIAEALGHDLDDLCKKNFAKGLTCVK